MQTLKQYLLDDQASISVSVNFVVSMRGEWSQKLAKKILENLEHCSMEVKYMDFLLISQGVGHKIFVSDLPSEHA